VYSDKERDQKKEQLLCDCFDLFSKKGLENTSMNDLAKHCGTYKASFYNYFESKDEIVLECATAYMKSLGKMLFNEEAFSQKSLRTALEIGFKVLVSERQKLRCIYQIVSSPRYGGMSRDALAEVYGTYLNYSSVLAEKYSVDKDKFRPYYLLYVATMHDYCLWENSGFVMEKLQYIFEQVDNLSRRDEQ